MRECSTALRRGGHIGGGICVGNGSGMAVVDMRQHNRATEGPAKIVIAQGRALDDLGGIGNMLVEKTIGIQPVVAEELVRASMKRVDAGAGDDIDLGATAATVFRIISAAHHLELFQGRSEERRVGKE